MNAASVALAVLATYGVALTLEVVTGFMAPPWPSLMASVPTWVDVLAIGGWAFGCGVLGGRRRSAGVLAHAIGVASVAGVVGFQASHVATVDPGAAVVASATLAALVVVALAIAWVGGRAVRAVLRRPAVDAAGAPLATWLAPPLVVIGLRWLA